MLVHVKSVVKMSKEYLDEMRKLELQEKQLRDRYNTEEEPLDKHNYKKIVNSDIRLAPERSETLKHYIEKIKIFQEISKTKNWDTHVDNSYKTWHTHRLPMGCFMCEDQQFIAVLVQVLECISADQKKFKFS